MDNLIIDGYEYVWNEKGFYENINEDARYDEHSMWGACKQHFGFLGVGWYEGSILIVKYLVKKSNYNARDYVFELIKNSGKSPACHVAMDEGSDRIIGGLW